MQTDARTAQYPYPQALAEDVAKAIWVQEAVADGSTRQWAEDAWEDLGGSESSEERAELEVKVAQVLRYAPKCARLDDLVAYVATRVN